MSSKEENKLVKIATDTAVLMALVTGVGYLGKRF